MDIFCKIIKKEVDANILFEEENLIAFEDANPDAPVHYLVVPKKHYEYLEQVDDANLLGEMLQAAVKVAEKAGVLESGFRVVINQKSDGGQIVPHLHLHVLGGKKLTTRLNGKKGGK